MSGREQGDWRDDSLCQFEESNLKNNMGLEFYDPSHPWGLGQPCWPYFEDVEIERRIPDRNGRCRLMQVVRFTDAQPYVAPKHFDMSCVRLQGMDASDAKTCWVGFSTFEPGGGAEMDATPLEKIYVVLSGKVTVTTEDESVTLGLNDSCAIAPNEARSVVNNTDALATMLVIMPYAKE